MAAAVAGSGAASLALSSPDRIAHAVFDSADTAAITTSTASVGAGSGTTGTKTGGSGTNCTSVDVAWNAAGGIANTYKVEAKTANGTWTTLNADTGNVTLLSDTTTYTQREVTWRVTPEYDNGSGLTQWTGAPDTSTALLCGGVGEVSDLAVAQSCDATLTWSAPAGATTYDVQYSTDGGTTWTAGATDQAGTSWLDTVNHGAGAAVLYQVRPGIGAGTDGNWSNTASIADWGCSVTDLAVSQACKSDALTWTAPGDATTYDRRYSTDGGTTWTTTTDAAGPGWTDNTNQGQGTTVIYEVRPGVGATSDGYWSAPVQVDDWGFHVVSITITNNGTAGVIDPGDTIDVTFNQAADPTTPNGTNSTSLYIRTNGGTKGLNIAAGASGAVSSGMILQRATAAFIGATTTFPGSASWDGTSTTWTWTNGSNPNVNETVTPTWGTATVGSSTANPARVKCSDGTTNARAFTPTVSGDF